MFSCRLSESPEAEMRDPQAVLPGEIFFYLVTGVNICGEGPAGATSAGATRSGWPSCAPLLRRLRR